MKFGFNSSTLIKLILILGLVFAAPYLVPFTLEFIIVSDLMGLEALIIVLLTFGKSIFHTLQTRLQGLHEHVVQTLSLIAELYIFKPKVYLGHATASSLVIVFASSVFLACAVWLPVMMASAGLMGA